MFWGEIMIKVENMFFGYKKKEFIKDVSFSVEKGEIFGLLGPSGAGKSTIQKIILGLLKNYRGIVKVAGTEAKDHGMDYYEKIGVDFEYPTLYNHLTAEENLRFFSSLYKGKKRDPKELLREIGLGNEKIKVGQFSKGMKSRLNFVKAIIHEPSVLLLDEPTSGLDPNNAEIMRELILSEKKKGTAIILTTHNMNDVEKICDSIAFLVDGTIKTVDSPENFVKKRGEPTVEYLYVKDGEKIKAECYLKNLKDDKLFHSLIKENRICEIKTIERTLEDIFSEVTGRKLV